MRLPQLFALPIYVLAISVLAISCDEMETCPAIDCNTGQLNEETCACDCPDGFTGTNCELEDRCVTENIVCENGGSCSDGVCDCPPGYTGSACENLDPAQVQSLLDSGHTPIELFNGGIPIDSLFGKLYQGGLIFYLNTTDGTGLVAALSDQGTAAEWGCFGGDISNLNNVTTCVEDCVQPEPDETEVGSRVGDGASNTDAILAQCSVTGIAADLCRGLGAAWFLPSRGELNLMYTHLHARGYGNFASARYWNSTECDFVISWFNDFASGTHMNGNKGDEIHVRAVRAF